MPYVIGIAGSVAVGKSTSARILQALLTRWPEHPRVELITTDGFLHPNSVLNERGIMNRKGFPESYDTKRLVQFLREVKAGTTEVAAPVYSHVVYDIVDGDEIAALPGYEDFTRDLIDPVLEEAAKLCEEVLHPLNRSGDEEGCHWDNGVVRTPKGLKEAYDLFREGGWTSIACDPAYGGQGMPAVVNTLVEEMICSANLSFGMYPGLSHGAYVSLSTHGSDELKATYLPKLVDGTWSGTMCLTEPHCGTDLGLLRTAAIPEADGSYAITGTKIFISAGEHDLTENILHLVLAKIPGGPKGVKGISLFLVPKFFVNEDG